MYNLWYIVIGSVPILILGIVLIICSKRSWCSYDSEYTLELSGVIIIALAITLIITFISLSICFPKMARQEYQTFINTQELVEEIYNEDSTLENAGLTNIIIDLNKWLAEAKASKEIYGNWSMYYALDLDNLEYIQLKVVP